MDIMKVYFKNGTSCPIKASWAADIENKILQGAKPWQCFYDRQKIVIIINLSEVTHII